MVCKTVIPLLKFVLGNTKAFANQKELSYTDHTHDISMLSGTLSIEHGGTGVTTLDELRVILGVSGNSVTSYGVNISNILSILYTFTLPVNAQYMICQIRDTTIGRSVYTADSPPAIGTGEMIDYYQSSPSYYYIYACLSSDGSTLWISAIQNRASPGIDTSFLIYY